MFIIETDILLLIELKIYLNNLERGFFFIRKDYHLVVYIFMWLGHLGSNQGISESEADALPLGYTPIIQRGELRPLQELLLEG